MEVSATDVHRVLLGVDGLGKAEMSRLEISSAHEEWVTTELAARGVGLVGSGDTKLVQDPGLTPAARGVELACQHRHNVADGNPVLPVLRPIRSDLLGRHHLPGAKLLHEPLAASKSGSRRAAATDGGATGPSGAGVAMRAR